MTVQATTYDGSKTYDLLEKKDMTFVETRKVTVDGANFYLTKSNNVIHLTIYCARAFAKNTFLTFHNVIPSGWNPTEQVCVSYNAIGGISIFGSGRYTINPDNQDVNLICNHDGYLEHMASVSWIIGGVFK